MSSTGHFLNEGETIFPEQLLAAATAALDAAKKKGAVSQEAGTMSGSRPSRQRSVFAPADRRMEAGDIGLDHLLVEQDLTGFLRQLATFR